MGTQIDQLRRWVGRTASQRDTFTTRLAHEVAALLEQPAPRAGASVPPLWHWALFPQIAAQSQLGPDGHAERGDFLPPVELPRRLWAGSRLTFRRALRVGSEISRSSHILDVAHKQGRRGELVLVRVRHEVTDAEGPLLTEEQDIAYCERPRSSDAIRSGIAAPTASTWRQTIVPDAVLLFRYSAVTFNGHRIHYDRRYAELEGYPALVVHGPLIATMLVGLVSRNLPARPVAAFAFRAMAPIFDDRPFHLCAHVTQGNPDVRVWVENFEGGLCIDGHVTLGDGDAVAQ